MPRGSLTNPTREDILELARKTRELVELCWDHPFMNKAQPERSPKMLWHTADFLRRTWTDYIAPLLPASMASLPPGVAFADPRCQDARRGMPGAPPRSSQVIHDEEAKHAWPRFNSEKYTDALMRNTMAEKIILKPNDMMVQLMFGRGDSGFDFDDEIKAKARALNKHDREETGREGDGDKTEQTGAAAAQESSIGDEVGGSSGKKARNAKKREKKKEKKNKGKNQEEGEGSDGNDDEAESEAGKENETAPAGGDKEAEWETE